jgi:uncharacterized protein YbaP (TraB family)
VQVSVKLAWHSQGWNSNNKADWMLRSWMRRVTAAFGLAALASGVSAAPAAKPALWSVSDADTTVYLFGTIHLLPKDYAWQTQQFNAAVTGSQQLVIETIVDEADPREMMGAMATLAFSPNLPPIATRVPAAKRAELEAAIAKSGTPRDQFDRMETWAAAFMLLGNQFKSMGLKMGAGVETTLRNAFKAQGKSVGQLESNHEQLSFFDALPESAQLSLLEGAISEPKDMGKQFEGMLGSWARGDVDAIAATFNRDLADSPALRDALLKRRNANWTRWVSRRMASPGSVMVAVGAGHLAGHDSLIAMLKRDGFRVRRVQ